MIEIILSLAGGIIALYAGAELLIFGGASLAYRLGIPLVVIGLVIVGYGTGMPELIVTLQAGFEGRGDIAIGNVIGSNIANIGLILGVASLIQPAKANKRLIRFDVPILFVVTLAFSMFLFWNGSIGPLKGCLLILGLIVYTVWAVRHGEAIPKEQLNAAKTRSSFYDVILIASGFAILFVGGRLFLHGSVAVAKIFGISDAVIGLTIVAFGTSLPELATCVIAGARQHGEIVLGNIIGSNIFNILAIVGVAAIITPISFTEIDWIDYSAMLALVVILAIQIQRNQMVSRIAGVFYLLFYVSYITIKYVG